MISDAERKPLVTPGYSRSGVKSTAVLPLLAKAGPWFNKKVVYREIDKAYSRAVDRGLQMAADTGQRGMLLEITVLQEETPGAQTYYSIYGAGVRMVGVGPDAHTVALTYYRNGLVKLPVRRNAEMTSDSQFVWMEPTLKGYNFSTYPLDLADWVRELNAQQVAAIDRSGQAKAMDGFLSALQQRARDAQTRKEVDELVRSRKAAQQQREQADKELADELRRQERIAQAQAGLSALSMALSLGSAIAVANTTIGMDVGAAAGQSAGSHAQITSYDDLAGVLTALKDNSAAKVVELKGRSTRFTTEMGTLEMQAWRIGVDVGLKPSDAPVLQGGQPSNSRP